MPPVQPVQVNISSTSHRENSNKLLPTPKLWRKKKGQNCFKQNCFKIVPHPEMLQGIKHVVNTR